MLFDSNLLVIFADKCKENLYAKMEKLEAQICRCISNGLKVMPWAACLFLTQTIFFFLILPTTEIIALLTGKIGANLPASHRGIKIFHIKIMTTDTIETT